MLTAVKTAGTIRSIISAILRRLCGLLQITTDYSLYYQRYFEEIVEMLRFLRQAAAYLAVEASGEVESASSLANDPDAATTCDSPMRQQEALRMLAYADVCQGSRRCYHL